MPPSSHSSPTTEDHAPSLTEIALDILYTIDDGDNDVFVRDLGAYGQITTPHDRGQPVPTLRVSAPGTSTALRRLPYRVSNSSGL